MIKGICIFNDFVTVQIKFAFGLQQIAYLIIHYNMEENIEPHETKC
jgi:hypothetical protein